MKIAVKDSDQKRAKKLAELLASYYKEQGENIQIDTFNISDDLINGFHLNEYSLVFLEMEQRSGEIPGIPSTGMDVARELRKFAPYLPIIFMNWISDSIVEFSFVAPRHYVINAFQSESLFTVMNSISKQIAGVPERTLCITSSDKTVQVIPIPNIVYAEVTRKIITIHLYGGETLKTISTMKQFTEQLSVCPEFIVPHKSFIVNAVYIAHISFNELTLRSIPDKIPVSRNRIGSVIEAYQNYFQKYCILPYPKEDRLAEIDE